MVDVLVHFSLFLGHLPYNYMANRSKCARAHFFKKLLWCKAFMTSIFVEINIKFIFMIIWRDKMLYIITDTHLGHENMKHLCNRPDDFTEQIFSNLSILEHNDTLIHLGDVAWGDVMLRRFLDLPFKKILVRGNHDQKSTFSYMNDGFDFVCNTFTAKMEGLDILFSHHPQYFHHHDINIHGHMHNLSREDFSCTHLPLSLENMNYKPIKLDKSFINAIRGWKKNSQSLKDIMTLHQNALAPRDVDLYGPCRNKEIHERRIHLRAARKALIDKHNIDYADVRDTFEQYFSKDMSDQEFLEKLNK